MTTAPDWRRMTQADLDAVVEVARVSFPDHPEDRAVFAERLALHPAGCYALGAPAQGYLVAYPWRADQIPPLNTGLGAIPADADLIYLHDLALAPEARGGGRAARAVVRLLHEAGEARWPAVALVAVNEAAPFWRKLGFQERETPAIRDKLKSYGPDARYMVRRLTT
jgi:ribosomal protein S18 acetylase RimI-like enzyme